MSKVERQKGEIQIPRTNQQKTYAEKASERYEEVKRLENGKDLKYVQPKK